MSQKIKNSTAYAIHELITVIPLFISWSLSSTLVLFFSGYFEKGSPDFLTVNEDAQYHIGLIFIAHAVAFSVMPIIYLLTKPKLNKFIVIAFSVAGAAAAYIQFSWRQFADSFGRLDCANQCVSSVVPAPLGQSINIGIGLLLVTLWAAYVLLVYLVWRYQLKNGNRIRYTK